MASDTAERITGPPFCLACVLRIFRGPREYDDGFKVFGRLCRVCHTLDDRGEVSANGE